MTQLRVLALLWPKFGKKSKLETNREQVDHKKLHSKYFILKKLILFVMLNSTFFCAHANSNPASIQFVVDVATALRKEFTLSVVDVATALRKEFSLEFQSLGTRLNQLSTSFNTQINEMSKLLQQGLDPLKNQINNLPIVSHQIGDRVEGGIVFFVDQSLQHGLVASVVDLHEGIEWRNGESGDRLVNASAFGVGAGETNTRLVIAQQTIDQQEGQFAALVAANYQVTAQGEPCAAFANNQLCYGGWFLPSLQELSLLLTNLKQSAVENAPAGIYWSSTEGNFTQAWALDSNQPEPLLLDKAMPEKIRAIRKF